MNTFGIAALQLPLYDARSVVQDRARFGRPAIRALERANHFHAPAGRMPMRGWLLMARGDYDKLDPYATNLQLNIGNPTLPDNVGTLKNLSIVQAQCVTRGLGADDKALYLVEITDGRGILHNQWFSFPLTAAYNIRAPGYPQTFLTGTMNGGTTWTWASMLQSVWEAMGTHLGAWPGLPPGVSLAGTPEGFRFAGVPAWPALCDVLDYLGLEVAYDPTQDAPYTIVRPGAEDASFTTLQARYTTHLEDDLEWIDTGAGRVPHTVKVLFRRRNSIYGTEETGRYDSLQWNTSPHYTVSVSAPATFSSAVGTHHIWSDFTVRYDHDGNPLAADTATASAIAAERVTQYFAAIYDQTLGYMSQTYAGALPFATGSRVDSVCWYMDAHRRPDNYYGWRTRITRGDGECSPWEDRE